MDTTPGRLLIEEALPEPYKNRGAVLDGKGIKALFQEIAEKHPHLYAETVRRLMKVGADVAYASGGFSFDIDDMGPSDAVRAERQRIDMAVARILNDPQYHQDPDARDAAIVKLLSSAQKPIEKLAYEDALSRNNPLALQVASGTRGNPMNLKSLMAGDLLYEDHRLKPVPIPITRSYSEGLTPAQYWAGTYGARQGLYSVKKGTADSGYLAKTLVAGAHDLLVTALDRDDDPEHDHSRLGLPVDTDDADSVGSLLSQPVGGYPRNTRITPRVLSDLKSRGIDRILVRSPITGGPPGGGVYARDVGYRERGGLSPRGDYVGVAASQAISEKITQGALCLVKGTRVRMANWTTKPIEEICPGDWVMGSNLRGEAFPVEVVARYRNGPKPCVRYEFGYFSPSQCGISLESTADHKVLAERRYGPEHLVLPHTAKRAIGEFDSRCLAILSNGIRIPLTSQEDIGLQDTFDIAVDHADHLFLLENGLIVSNSSKHTGGVAGESKVASGFQYISNLLNPPKTFAGVAAHAQKSGTVSGLKEAPQGGYFVNVAGERHHIPAGHDPTVKDGDTVEAGDVLCDGPPNPAEVVRFKGIGEGRKYLVHAMREAIRGMGQPVNRRNLELLAAGMVNHVRMKDEYRGHSPDEIVRYSDIAHSYEPRQDSEYLAPERSVGQYLEEPALHHSIGTRVTNAVRDDLKSFGIKRVRVHPEPPPFEPTFIRGVDAMSHYPDWMTQHLGSGLQKSTLRSAHRGATSDAEGASYVPALAERAHFGQHGLTQGWNPADLPRDGDGDGRIYDGTPRERDDPRRR